MKRKVLIGVGTAVCAVLIFFGGFLTHKGIADWKSVKVPDLSGVPTDCEALEEEYTTAIDRAHSTVDICDVNKTYAQKWERVVGEYYGRLLQVCDAEMCDGIETSQKAWQRYAEAYLEEQMEYYEYISLGGTGSGQAITSEEYTIYRDRAFKLRDMYEEIQDAAEFYETWPLADR